MCLRDLNVLFNVIFVNIIWNEWIFIKYCMYMYIVFLDWFKLIVKDEDKNKNFLNYFFFLVCNRK